VTATVSHRLPVAEVTSVRLDGQPDGQSVAFAEGSLTVDLGPHGMRSVLLRV
jgi:hypothetical protein